MNIGFSQRLSLPWLHRAAELAVQGIALDQATRELTALIGEHLSQGNDPQRGNRDKAVTILRRLWLVEDPLTQPLREVALALWPRATAAERLALHWGLASAAYPFWATVTEILGRLLILNGRVAPKQVQQRLRETLGSRETVVRAGRRIWSTLHDWGVLKPSPTRGFSLASGKSLSLGPAVSVWLSETQVVAGRGEAYALARLLSLPALFPFSRQVPEQLEPLLTKATKHFLDSEGSVFLKAADLQGPPGRQGMV